MMNISKRTTKLFFIGCLLLSAISCKDFLDVKPDKKLVVPSSSDDLLALMNHVANMNYGYVSGLGEIASDNLYVQEHVWHSLSHLEANIAPYIWDRIPVIIFNWNTMYSNKILSANIVIDRIDQVSHPSMERRKEILGMAYYFRGLSFFDIGQAFAPPYDPATAAEKLGIVLRLTPDVNERSTRSSVQASYDQITADLLLAADLLPSQRPLYPTRPYKAAAFAALSRCFLAMGDYAKAGGYADSALMLQSNLLDYKAIAKKDYPFERFNEEVIFYSQMDGQMLLGENTMRVDSSLIKLYMPEDLRMKLYFKPMADGYFTFVGDYSEQTSLTFFNGFTTAEMLLNRAECLVRNGNVAGALRDLSTLREMRYQAQGSDGLSDMDASRLLQEILDERRKELVFRGIRWSDIRRLNRESPLSLQKVIGDKVYTLKSDDIKRFAFLIPELVVERVPTIEQN